MFLGFRALFNRTYRPAVQMPRLLWNAHHPASGWTGGVFVWRCGPLLALTLPISPQSADASAQAHLLSRYLP